MSQTQRRNYHLDNPAEAGNTLNHPKIKLAGVHAIRLSKDRKIDSSRSLKKVVTDNTYQKVFYYKDYKGDYGEPHDNAYEQLADALEGEANFEPFKSSRELEKKEALKGKKKYIVFASTNEASIKIMKDLRKAKLNYFDFLLLGHLDPRQDLLDDNLLLASSDPNSHITFLIDHGFHSHNLHSISQRLSKSQPNNAQPFLTFEGGPQQSKVVVVESPIGKIDQEPAEKKKIRKIKSPGKGKQSQISQIQPQGDSQSANNINIIVSMHKEESIVENDLFRTNKQGERIYKQPSIKETSKQIVQQAQQQDQPIVYQPDPKLPSPYQPVSNQASNYFDAKAQNNVNNSYKYPPTSPSDHQSSSKKAIEAKYKSPSVIIQEMSDEYRGSNKESIVNLEPQKPKTEYPLNPSEPIEQNTAKRVVSKGVSQPETHYIHSTQTINSNRTINTNTSIPAPPQNAYNSNRYASPTNYRYVPSTPMTVTTMKNESEAQSSRFIRKEAAVTIQVKKEEKQKVEQNHKQEKSREENRITFGANQLTNATTYGTNYNSYRNAASPNSNYYNTQTLNYYTINGQPYESKINISTGRTEQISTNRTQQIVSPPQKQVNEETRIYAPYLSPPKVDQKGTKQFVSSTIFNNDDYEQIERDGRIIYRKKVPTDSSRYNKLEYSSKDEDGSPVVKRYETSPIRYNANNTVNTTNTYTSHTYTQNNQTNSYGKVQPNPIRREPQITYGGTYQYGKPMGGSVSTTVKGNLQIITVPYNKPEEHLGEMIQSSHKKKANESTTRNDGKNFVTVSYKNEDRSSLSNNLDNGVRIYGVAHPRVDVERVQIVQPKVNAPVPKDNPRDSFASPKKVLNPPNPRSNPAKLPPEPPKVKVQVAKPKAELTPKADLSPIPKNTLNQSNWFSRMSELHSDGSILRRNNIRFGVKLQKKQQRVEGNSVVENKLVSGIYKVNDLNKKMALNRIIQGEEYIEEERQKYSHIDPSLNRFHLLLQEDMQYLLPTLRNYLARPHDRIDSFAGVHQLFSTLTSHSQGFDFGFIFAREEEIKHINPLLLPEGYYLVSIQGEQGLLQINQTQRRVRVDQLRHFTLVQRIILDSQLYQYVAYRNSRPQVELLADKFVNSQFILEKIETQFTTQILDCYYYELPRLTRLYLLCDQQELPGLLAVVQAYSDLNPAFKKETCKLVCVLSNILANDHLIMAHPTVTFISNPQQVTHFRHILRYAHHYDPQDAPFIPTDHLFYHNNHTGLDQQLSARFPGRFQMTAFTRVSEVYPQVQKLRKASAKDKCQIHVYLVLHENVNAEKIRTEFFNKIFMLGKAKVVQNKVVRVMNTEELMELLNK